MHSVCRCAPGLPSVRGRPFLSGSGPPDPDSSDVNVFFIVQISTFCPLHDSCAHTEVQNQSAREPWGCFLAFVSSASHWMHLLSCHCDKTRHLLFASARHKDLSLLLPFFSKTQTCPISCRFSARHLTWRSPFRNSATHNRQNVQPPSARHTDLSKFFPLSARHRPVDASFEIFSKRRSCWKFYAVSFSKTPHCRSVSVFSKTNIYRIFFLNRGFWGRAYPPAWSMGWGFWCSGLGLRKRVAYTPPESFPSARLQSAISALRLGSFQKDESSYISGWFHFAFCIFWISRLHFVEYLVPVMFHSD